MSLKGVSCRLQRANCMDTQAARCRWVVKRLKFIMAGIFTLWTGPNVAWAVRKTGHLLLVWITAAATIHSWVLWGIVSTSLSQQAHWISSDFRRMTPDNTDASSPMNILLSWISQLTVCCKKLAHWGRVTHKCVGKLTIIGSDNGLSPRRRAIIWTNAGILLIGPLGTNFSEISLGIQPFSAKKMHLKMSSAKWRPVSFGLNVLKTQ